MRVSLDVERVLLAGVHELPVRWCGRMLSLRWWDLAGNLLGSRVLPLEGNLGRDLLAWHGRRHRYGDLHCVRRRNHWDGTRGLHWHSV